MTRVMIDQGSGVEIITTESQKGSNTHRHDDDTEQVRLQIG